MNHISGTDLDSDDISGCPLAERCASCRATAGREIAVISTPIGVYCQTLCASCVAANRLPALDWPTAADLVGRHCEHLGCDLDQMAAALRAGRGAR